MSGRKLIFKAIADALEAHERTPPRLLHLARLTAKSGSADHYRAFKKALGALDEELQADLEAVIGPALDRLQERIDAALERAP